MTIKPKEIYSWNHEYRLKFINSLSGYKGVHLIGSIGKNRISNLAIFNSIVHISSEPARIGFIVRPLSVRRDTYNNIIDTGYFTINHVHKSFVEKAHFTSLKLEKTESEFDLCNFTEQFISNFHAPFVGESNIKIGLKLIEDIEIKESGCRLIIGEVLLVETEEQFLEKDGQLDLEKSYDVCVTGLNQYSSVNKMINIPYARRANLPNFCQKKRPDNIVFDEKSQTYNAHLLPYGSNVGSPSIKAINLSAWKTRGINSFNHVLKSQIEGVKSEYDTLVNTYKINELLYKAKYEFEPIIGETYHLYVRDNSDENFLSMIPPNTWRRTHLGSFKLNSNKVWEEIKD